MLEIKSKIPKVKLKNANGETIDVSKDFKGKKLVIYFYPKDNTSGCTKEAISVNEYYEELKKFGLEVVGVSPDSIESHVKFRDKNDLKFNLLADTENELSTACGAYGEKKMYGRSYMGVIRSTFIFDEKGELIKVFPKVKTAEHGKELKDFFESLDK